MASQAGPKAHFKVFIGFLNTINQRSFTKQNEYGPHTGLVLTIALELLDMVLNLGE
jgi:hypothetical protein